MFRFFWSWMMPEPEPPVHVPSLFAGALRGFLIAAPVGFVVAFVLAIRAGHYADQAAFELIVCAGAIGGMWGFNTAAKRRQAMGFGAGGNEWRQFFGSSGFWLFWLIALVGSLVIAAAGGFLFDAIIRP
jgi:hypothetical protein